MAAHQRDPLLPELQSLRKGAGLTVGKFNHTKLLRAGLHAKSAVEAHGRFLELLDRLDDGRPVRALKNALNLDGKGRRTLTDRRNDYAALIKMHEDTVEDDENRALNEILARLSRVDPKSPTFGHIRGVAIDCKLRDITWDIHEIEYGGWNTLSPSSEHLLYIVPKNSHSHLIGLTMRVEFEGTIRPTWARAVKYDSIFAFSMKERWQAKNYSIDFAPIDKVEYTWTDVEPGIVLMLEWNHLDSGHPIAHGQLAINPFSNIQDWEWDDLTVDEIKERRNWPDTRWLGRRRGAVLRSVGSMLGLTRALRPGLGTTQ